MTFGNTERITFLDGYTPGEALPDHATRIAQAEHLRELGACMITGVNAAKGVDPFTLLQRETKFRDLLGRNIVLGPWVSFPEGQEPYAPELGLALWEVPTDSETA